MKRPAHNVERVCDSCGYAVPIEANATLASTHDFLPPGWSRFSRIVASISAAGELCPDCTTAVLAALTERAPVEAVREPKIGHVIAINTMPSREFVVVGLNGPGRFKVQGLMLGAALNVANDSIDPKSIIRSRGATHEELEFAGLIPKGTAPYVPKLGHVVCTTVGGPMYVVVCESPLSVRWVKNGEAECALAVTPDRGVKLKYVCDARPEWRAAAGLPPA